LLGQRGQEIIGMKWSEVDFRAKTWDIASGRTKNRRLHSVPLPPTAFALLERRRKELPDTEPCVFPGLTALLRALEAWDRLIDEIVTGRGGDSVKIRPFRSRGSRPAVAATKST
jgi:integrase